MQDTTPSRLATARAGVAALPWKKLGFAASATVIAFACWTLVRTLEGIDGGAVMAALGAKQPPTFALAALCVVGAFFTLTFYDLFALRTIGRDHVPYRIAALSGSASYAIGHNIGATVFTGGAIRYRIYSGWGLSAIDVAKVVFLSGLTFWLGNIFVLGIGMAWHPSAAGRIDMLPDAVNALIGAGCLLGIAAYFAWLSTSQERRRLGRNGWTVTLPSWRLTLLQVAIGVIDLGFCAEAFHLLMPDAPRIDFMSSAVVFILATLLGFASHAPGSLGVFDAAMLVAFPQFPREEMVATLLIYRMLYFVIPFAVSIAIMSVREAMIALRRNSPTATAADTARTDKA